MNQQGNILDQFLNQEIRPEVPEWVHLHWMTQNGIQGDKQKAEIQISAMKDCTMQNQLVRERNSLSYEIHLQRSYLHYARKELPYEEVREIETRYKELKNLYWKLFGYMI